MSSFRLSADKGVAAAVESCNTNTKSKHMVMFGLRALSDLCIYPCGNYKENALDALARNVIITFTQIFDSLKDDKEVVELIIKVCWGISAGLKEYKAVDYIENFKASGGAELVAGLIQYVPPIDKSVLLVFEMTDMLAANNIQIDISSVTIGTVNALTLTLNTDTYFKISKVAQNLSKTSPQEMVAAVPDTISRFLQFSASIATSSDKMSTEVILNLLLSSKNLAAYTSADLSCVSNIKYIIETTANPKILQAGSNVLEQILTLEQLTSALNDLNLETTTPEKRESALDLLIAMSFVDSFSEAIAKAGCIPLFVNVVKNTTPKLSADVREDSVVKGYIGTVKLLQRMSNNPQHADNIYNLNGIAILSEAAVNLEDHPTGLCVSLLAISAIMQHSEQYIDLAPLNICLKLLYNSPDNLEIQEGCLNLLKTVSVYDSFKQTLIEESAFELISYSLQYLLDDLNTKQLAFSILKELASEVYTTSFIYEYGGFVGISNTLIKHARDLDIVTSAFNTLVTLTSVNDSKTYGSADGVVVDAVLIAVSENSENATLVVLAQDILEHFATESDAERHAQNLDQALSESLQKPYNAVQALAATYGLSDIKRLTSTFEKVEAAPLILKHLTIILKNGDKLMKPSSASESLTVLEKILRLGMTSVLRISQSTVGELDNVVPSAIVLLYNDRLKQITLKDSDTTEKLLDRAISLTELDRFNSGDAVEKCITNALSLLGFYSFSKKVVELIVVLLIQLMFVQNMYGIKVMHSKKAELTIFAVMKQSPYHVNVQIRCLTLLNMLLQADPKRAELLPKAEVIKFLHTLLRTFLKETQLRASAAPILSLLVTESELEQILIRNLDSIDHDLKKKHLSNAAVNMRICNDFLVGNAATRTLIRLQAPSKLQSIQSLDTNDPNYMEVIAEGARLVERMTEINSGANLCSELEYHLFLLKIAQTLAENRDVEGCLHALNALGNIIYANRKIHPVLFEADVLGKLTKINELYADNTMISAAICRILGGLATSETSAVRMEADPRFLKLISFLKDIEELDSAEQSLNLTYALNSISQNASPKTTKYILETNILRILIDQLEMYPNDKNLTNATFKLITNLKKNDKVLRRQDWQPDDLHRIARVFASCVTTNISDATYCCNAIDTLACFKQFDVPLLKETQMITVIHNCLDLHGDDENLPVSIKNLFVQLEAEKSIMSMIQQFIDCDAKKNEKGFLEALDNLNLLLISPIQNYQQVFQKEEQLWKIMNRQMMKAQETNDIKTMRALLCLSQRLIAQGKNDPSGYSGAWYCSQHFLPSCFEILNNEHPALDNKRLNVALMNLFTAVAQNPDTFSAVCDQINVPLLVKQLEAHQTDLDISAAILMLLKTLKENEIFLQTIVQSGKDILKKRDIIALMADIALRHKNNRVTLPAMEFAGACARSKAIQTPDALTNRCMISAALRCTAANFDQPNIDAELMEFFTACLDNPACHKALKAENVIVACQQRLDHNADLQKPLRDVSMGYQMDEHSIIRNNVVFARMIEGFGNYGMDVVVHEKNIMPKLKEILDEYTEVPDVQIAAIAAIIANTPEIYNEAYDDYYTQIVNGVIQTLQNNPEDINADFKVDPKSSVGRLMFFNAQGDSNIQRAKVIATAFNNLMDPAELEYFRQTKEGQTIFQESHEEISEYYLVRKNVPNAPESMQELQPEIQPQNVQLVDPSDPDALTLKQNHEWLVERLNSGQIIDIYDESVPIVAERFLFVVEKIKDYNDLMLTLDDFAGYQLQYGCMSLIVWLQNIPHSLYTMMEMDVHTILFNYLQHQRVSISKSKEKQVLVTTPCSRTLVQMCEDREHFANVYATKPEIVALTVDNINKCTADPAGSCADEHVIPRLQLVQKLAINRQIYKKPDIVLAVNEVWKLYDETKYGPLALKEGFRALRMTACGGHTDTIIQLDIMRKLVDELEKDHNNPISSDGFFLLGIYSLDPRLKLLTVKFDAVYKSLIILRNHVPDPPEEGVSVNCMLAIANMIIDNSANRNTFLKYKGPQLNSEILILKKEHLEEIGAATALLTNACFRRDDIKALYGSKELDAPPSLVAVLAHFDGSAQPAVIRCLKNLFKAISNLALFPPNIDLFLQSRLEHAYYNLIQRSEQLPNEIIETAFFTLISLSSELKPENLTKLGTLIPPIVHMFSNPERQAPVLIQHANDAIIFMVRDEHNARVFCEEGGIVSLKYLFDTCAKASSVGSRSILKLLSTLARWPVCVEHIVQNDILLLCKHVIEGVYYYEDDTEAANYEMAYLSFKIYRRMFCSGGALVIGVLSQIDAHATVLWYIESLASSADPYQQLSLETLRVFIGALAIANGDNPANYEIPQDHLAKLNIPLPRKKKWFGGAPTNVDEMAPLELPENTRIYELIGITPDDVSTIIKSLVSFTTNVSHVNDLHFAAYTSCILSFVFTEQIPNSTAIIVELIPSIATIYKTLYENIGTDLITGYYMAQVIANFAYFNPDDFKLHFAKGSVVHRLVNDMLKFLKNLSSEEKGGIMVRNKLEDVLFAWNAILDGETEKIMQPNVTYRTDFCLCGWFRERYPNGVQDLECKEELRAGGHCIIINNDYEQEIFIWRANKTLTLFQWITRPLDSKETTSEEFEHSVPITRIENVQGSLCTEFLRIANKKLRGVYNETVVYITGPFIESTNSQMDVSLKFKNKSERDEFIKVIQDWKEAASN